MQSDLVCFKFIECIEDKFMSNRSLGRVDWMHRYTNDVTMLLLLAAAAVVGYSAWRLWSQQNPDPKNLAQLCQSMISASGRPTRMVGNQCQMEIFPARWYNIQLSQHD